MKIALTITMVLALATATQAQRSDGELNRDSIVGWKYVSNPINPKAVYKPIKSQYANGATYSAWQQQASDILINWIQQSYLPRGIVMRTLTKNDERWNVDGNGPLQSYGVNFLGYAATFVQGKIDLRCCEQGQRLVAGFNDFPGVYLKGFNPGGMYFFAEQAQFSSGDDDAQLSKEGIDKKIQPNLYGYRTYLDHYHDNGQQMFKIGVVVPKNGEWPFKPVLVKDAIAFYNQQLAAYPDLLKYDYDYRIKQINAAIERLKPFYNEPAKILNRTILTDEKGHSAVSPVDIINGKNIDKTFPEYFMLVAATQQTINQTKTDNPLWMYLNLTPMNVSLIGNPAKFDTKFGTGSSHMAYSLLRNFNFDYVAKWLANPEAMKSVPYKPLNLPAQSTANNIVTTVNTSANATAKNKDPFTILYEDFDGYETGAFSAAGWHTYGHNGHSFENATLSTIAGQSGKWINIPDAFTFYPDFAKPLPASFTVNYDVYFDSKISNKRSAIYFRLDTYDPNPKKSNPIDLHDINRNGFQFEIAPSGETEVSKRFMEVKYDETLTDARLTNIKTNEPTHISIAVNGAAVSVTVNGKEVMHDDNVLPLGKTFKRYGWYCGVQGIYLSNILVKSSTPVQSTNPKEPQFAGVVKENPKAPTFAAAAFENTPYVPATLPKLDALPLINYPAGFKSAAMPIQTGSNKAVAGLKMDYKFPEKSALLSGISNTVVAADGFKKLITDIQSLVSNKLQQPNTVKIDNYLKTKKITRSVDISNLAISTWMENKPTAALYLFCKALLADYSDMLTANNLSSLLIAYGYAEKAIPVLQYINKQTNGAPETLANLATAYYNLGDLSNALDFAEKSIAKDSINANANKVAAFAHLNKAAKTSDKAETEKAIACLKQALKSGYDKEASNILSKIESNHQASEDFVNTNFKEFPMLKRIQMPAMPEDLHQMISFNKQLELEKSALTKTSNEVFAAYKKIPDPDPKQLAAAGQNISTAMMMAKSAAIISQTSTWYMKMKKDLEDIFILNKKDLTKKYSEKISAVNKKYNVQLNKLEGGEGKADEEEEIERLKTQRCEEYNKESSIYLSDMAKLTNSFAQQSEYVSRVFCRDYANWKPAWLNDNSGKFFLEAQRVYLIDIQKILSLYTAIEPCIYPLPGQNKEEKKQAKPKEWEEEYCANFKGTAGLGAVKIGFNCNSMSISGGEGFVGDLTLNYNENGKFKDITIGAGAGVEAHWGNKQIASLSAGASVTEYITIGAGPNGSISVTDWGTSAGVGAGANISAVGGEANIFSGKISAASGVSAEGAIPDALKIINRAGGKE